MGARQRVRKLSKPLRIASYVHERRGAAKGSRRRRQAAVALRSVRRKSKWGRLKASAIRQASRTGSLPQHTKAWMRLKRGY